MLIIFEVSEVKATHAIGLQLYQAGSEYRAVEVDDLVRKSRFRVHDPSSVIGHHYFFILHKFTSPADFAVCESRRGAAGQHDAA